jgi:hypothetical protein
MAFRAVCAAAARTQARAWSESPGSGNRLKALMKTSCATSWAAWASPTTPKAMRTTAGYSSRKNRSNPENEAPGGDERRSVTKLASILILSVT